MASKCTWGRDKVTGNIVHVSEDIVKENVICLNCGCKLIKCEGEKKSAYFRHPNNNPNKNCKGGTGETILHELAKTVIKDKFEIPEDYVPFLKSGDKKVINSNKFNLMSFTQEIEHTLKLSDGSIIRPDIYLNGLNIDVYIEIKVTHGVNTEKKNKYYKYLLNREIDKPWIVVEINLSEMQSRINDVTLEEIYTAVVTDNPHKRVIASKFQWDIENLLRDSYYETSGDIAVCPAKTTGNDIHLNKIKNCRKCPYFVSNAGGKLLCMGNKCYTSSKDVLSEYLLGQTKEHRFDKYIAPSSTYRTQRYQSLKNRLGVCQCGGSFEFAQSPDRTRFSCFTTKSYSLVNADIRIDNDFIYRVCTSCGAIEIVTCPKCGEPMKLLRNPTSGKVFLACNHYKNKNVGTGSVSNKASNNCSASLTVFTDDSCRDMHWDAELLWWGNLDNYLNPQEYQKYVNTFYNTRNLWLWG